MCLIPKYTGIFALELIIHILKLFNRCIFLLFYFIQHWLHTCLNLFCVATTKFLSLGNAEKQKSISHTSGGWEVQDLSTSNFSCMVGVPPLEGRNSVTSPGNKWDHTLLGEAIYKCLDPNQKEELMN